MLRLLPRLRVAGAIGAAAAACRPAGQPIPGRRFSTVQGQGAFSHRGAGGSAAAAAAGVSCAAGLSLAALISPARLEPASSSAPPNTTNPEFGVRVPSDPGDGGRNERELLPLDAPIAKNYPTAANAGTAQWRVYTDIGRDLGNRGRYDEAGRYLHRALHEAKMGFGDSDPHVVGRCRLTL